MPDVILGEFTTDLTPPAVTDPYPLPPDYAFPRDYVVQFRITDTESGVDTANMLITLAGAVAYDGTDVGNEWQPGYTGNITDEGGGTLLVEILTHPDFASYATVNVTVDAQDLAPLPNVMDQYAWSFEVEDYEPPYVDSGWAPTGTGVPVTALVAFTIKDDGAGVDLGTLNVTVGGVPAIVNGAFQTGFQGGSSDIDDSLAPQVYGVVIDASPDYDEWTTYEVIVNADDLAVAGPIIVASFDDDTVAVESFESWNSNLEAAFDAGSAIAAAFNDGVDVEEEFEYGPSNFDAVFDAGSAIAATFNDDVDSEEEFENWD